MKKIAPLKRYDKERQYPSTAELEKEAGGGRRSFLKGLLAGGAALGAGMLGSDEAAARGKPRPTPPPPGVPPRPDPRRRTPPEPKPPLPGNAPAPRTGPRPVTRPCNTTAAQTVTLDAVFAFCGNRRGQIQVTTTDARVLAKLKKPGEGRRLAPIAKGVFAREKSCAWLDRATELARVQQQLGRALTDAYQQALGAELQPLRVLLQVRPEHVRLGGVIQRSRRPPPRGGCASCSTDASLEDVLLPAAAVAAVLIAGGRRDD